jgi:hypothetical protein
MLRILKLGIAGLFLLCPLLGHGQEEEVSLGDLARIVRKAAPDQDRRVIDNDNLPLVMQKAEAERLNGKPVFSIDPSGKSFRMSSPDGSCSLSFDAKASALISTPYVSSSLPLDELARLDGTAAIHDGILEVQLHNGTAWELKEIVVGITLLEDRGPLLRSANLLGGADGELVPKSPDMTMLYHLKSTALPDGTTAFRGTLDQNFGPTTDWHWALVGARGVPPAGTATASGTTTLPPSPVASQMPITNPSVQAQPPRSEADPKR